MRNPRSSRNGAIAVAVVAGLIAASAAAAVLLLPKEATGETVRVLLIAGLGALGMVTLISAMLAVAWHVNLRTAAGLESGSDMMGRWRVEAPAWRAFVELERSFALQPNVWQNEFQARAEQPGGPVEVIVGSTGVVIDGSVHRLPRHDAPEVRAARLRRDTGVLPSIELHLFHPATAFGDGLQPARSTTLRFPIAPGAERVAMRYIAWCEAGRPGEASWFHGRGDGSDADDVSTCRSCGWQTHKFVSACERCGGSLLTRRWARRLGHVQIVMGALLSAGIGYVFWDELAPPWLRPAGEPGDMRFSGTRAQAVAAVTALAAAGAIGLATMFGGYRQITTGRTDRRVVRAVLGLIGVIVAAGVALAVFKA